MEAPLMRQAIEAIGKEDNQGTGLLAFHRWCIAYETRAKAQVMQVYLSPQQAMDKLKAGERLLSWNDLPLDLPFIQKCFNEALRGIAQYFPGMSKLAEDLCFIAQDTTLLQLMVQTCYENRSLRWAVGRRWGGRVERDVLRLAGQAALRPFLCAQQEKLAPLVSKDLWRRGTCPICGGLPDLSFLDGVEAERWLICSRCDARWLFKRLECPYCNDANQDNLSYLSDEEGWYRVYLCDDCHSYLKAIDLRGKAAPVDPASLRLETVDLDRQACIKGYKNPVTWYGYSP